MTLLALPTKLQDDPALVKVLGRADAVLSAAEPAWAPLLGAISQLGSRRPVVAAVPTSGDAERLHHDLVAYLGSERVDIFPAWETLPFERVSPSLETMGRRLRTLWHLRDPERAPQVIVAPIRALLQRMGPGVADIDPVVVGVGDVVDLDELVADLVHAGYRRDTQVEHRGDLAVRGSIVDIFPSTADAPVRIDLWGDEVDRLTEFSVGDQRSTIGIAEIEIFPSRELVPSPIVRERAERLMATEPWGREQWARLSDGEVFDGMESWLPWLADDESVLFDHVGVDAQVMLLEPRRLRDRAADILAEEADLASTLARTWGAIGGDDDASEFPRLHVPFDRLLSHTDAPSWAVSTTPEGPDVPIIAAQGWDRVVGDVEAPFRRVEHLIAEGYSVVVAADTTGTADRMATLLGQQGVHLPVVDPESTDISAQGGYIVVAPLERGVVLPEARVAVVSEAELTGRRRAHRRSRPRKRQAQGFFEDLTPGDYVVHHQHGVARYSGMVTRGIGGADRDYLLLEYRGDDKLYVPTDQIDVIRHYTGGDSPKVSKLGGADWGKQKAKVRTAVEEIAQELVVLYQQRISAPGHAFAEDTPWQAEFENTFPFQETPDQLKAITETKADMEAEHPMDRLVCGDVGFGKTEVALRAVFKAVQDGMQAAVLVPTTLLAQQHYQTFSERYAGFPIRVEVLSRFLTAAQARKIAQAVSEGEVDVIIGTHRLLSDDIGFKKLGLLVIDEEQRFGVQHKERIKSFKADVDVLTLTATPIPRTLEMSLTGIRDLTLLNTPPADRQPILTYVGEYDDRAVAEAIRRELLRDGQVFFVHNRVQSIEHTAAHLRELVPEARIATAHGQMDEGSLEQVVLDFWENNYDVLVCTTIIESGIDMPTVNTLVVDRADLLGLGQLHQIRGRVGRSGKRAYAYLFTPVDKVLSETAYERLKTIGEATDLGSGFKIAMRDLEIRGAGNMLGTGQSGHIAAVGYDLYCQLVTEAVAELKGETPPETVEINLELPFDANIPASYVPKEEMRLEAYRRLAAVTTADEVRDVRQEWEDRYGKVPKEAETLLDVARLRAECHRTGIREMTITKGPGFGGPKWVAKMGPLALLTSKSIRLARLHPKADYREEIGLLVLPLASTADSLVDDLITVLQDLKPEEDAA